MDRIDDIDEANRIIKVLERDVKEQFLGKVYWFCAFVTVTVFLVFWQR